MGIIPNRQSCHPRAGGDPLCNDPIANRWIPACAGMTLLLFLLLLSACGFTPLYAARDQYVQTELNQIQIQNIPDRSGQALKNALIDRFYKTGTPHDPIYILSVAPLSENKADLDITIDDESTRRQLRLSTTFTLKHRFDETAPVLTRTVYTIVSFNVLQSQFTTRVAEQNARDNAVAGLARQIEQGIVLYFQNPTAYAPHETDLP
jgi:LPS-assembly lipoprotein